MKIGDLVRWRTNGQLGLVLKEAQLFPSFVAVEMLDGTVKQIAENCLECLSEDR
tara:strand:+ start:154 stop:315 length:162 start_codon:yes stop_codon:yes gene_type:complete